MTTWWRSAPEAQSRSRPSCDVIISACDHLVIRQSILVRTNQTEHCFIVPWNCLSCAIIDIYVDAHLWWSPATPTALYILRGYDSTKHITSGPYDKYRHGPFL